MTPAACYDGGMKQDEVIAELNRILPQLPKGPFTLADFANCEPPDFLDDAVPYDPNAPLLQASDNPLPD